MLAGIPGPSEVLLSLEGSKRLFLGKSDGHSFFRPGPVGTWSAAMAIFYVLPAHLVMVWLEGDGSFVRLIIEAEALIIGWFAYGLASVVLLRTMGVVQYLERFLTAIFWTSIPVVYVLLGFVLVFQSGLVPAGVETVLTLGVVSANIWYLWFIAKSALDISGFQAGGVAFASILFEIVLDILITRGI